MPTANKMFQVTSRADQFWGKYDQPKFEKCPSPIYHKPVNSTPCSMNKLYLHLLPIFCCITCNCMTVYNVHITCLSYYNGPCLHTPLLVTFKRTLNTVPTFVISRANDDSSLPILPCRSLSTRSVKKQNS